MHDVDYCADPEARAMFPGRRRKRCSSLKATAFKLIVITNQSGIGRGYFTVEQYRAVEAGSLAAAGPLA